MAEKSFPFNAVEVDGVFDREYSAEDFAMYFGQFLSNGIYPNPSTGLKGMSLNNNMVVTVGRGSACIKGYGYEATEDIDIIINESNAVYNRKDIIVARLNLEIQSINTIYIAGTPGTNPKVPDLIRTSDFHDLQTTVITVRAGTQKILQSDMLDTRFDTDVCGLVTSVVNSVDTTELFNQYEDYLNQKITGWDATEEQQTVDFNAQLDAQQSEFDLHQEVIEDWFGGIKADISKLQQFDFDNQVYLLGHRYACTETTTDTITTYVETLYDTDNNIFAKRTSIDNEATGVITVNTVCESLFLNTTITYTEDGTTTEGVITSG